MALSVFILCIHRCDALSEIKKHQDNKTAGYLHN